MEGEGRKFGAGADGPTAVGRARRACGVLDDRDAARLTQRLQAGQVGREARLVNQDDGPGPAGELRLDRRRGQVLRRTIDVGEDRLRANVPGGVGGGRSTRIGTNGSTARSRPGLRSANTKWWGQLSAALKQKVISRERS